MLARDLAALIAVYVVVGLMLGMFAFIEPSPQRARAFNRLGPEGRAVYATGIIILVTVAWGAIGIGLGVRGLARGIRQVNALRHPIPKATARRKASE